MWFKCEHPSREAPQLKHNTANKATNNTTKKKLSVSHKREFM